MLGQSMTNLRHDLGWIREKTARNRDYLFDSCLARSRKKVARLTPKKAAN